MKKELAKILLNIAYLFIGGVSLTGIMQSINNDVFSYWRFCSCFNGFSSNIIIMVA
jgi:hypothetical protein